jgi:hypothetical protein
MVKETRKRRGRALKVKRAEDVQMADTTREDKEKKQGGHAEHAERVGEWKEVKSAIARLKEERKKLGKKEREKKKALSKEIKRLLDDAIRRGLTGKAEEQNDSEMEM